MLAAEAVHRDDGGLGIVGAVHPVRRRRRRRPRPRAARRGSRRAAGHTGSGRPPVESTSARRRGAPRAAMSEAAHTVIGMDPWQPEPLPLVREPRVGQGRRRLRPRDDRRRRDDRPHRDRARRAARRRRRRSSARATGSPIRASRSPRVPPPSTASRPSTRRAEGRPARRGRGRGRRGAARAAGCRHPDRRLQRALRLLAAQVRGAAPRHRRRSSTRRR